MNNQKYIHNCEQCVFLGQYHCYDEANKKNNTFDLYACVRNNLINTVIARYGDDGPEYYSGLIFATRKLIPQLVEALDRAQKFGYRYDKTMWV